jgi:hypothetical protein
MWYAFSCIVGLVSRKEYVLFEANSLITLLLPTGDFMASTPI